jgi:hypothetical protein
MLAGHVENEHDDPEGRSCSTQFDHMRNYLTFLKIGT